MWLIRLAIGVVNGKSFNAEIAEARRIEGRDCLK
jgi:hypothetical protein